MDQNQLRSWMEFYRKNMPQQGSDSLGSPFGGMGAMDQANQAGARLNFALRMAGQGGEGRDMSAHQMPDYFNGSGGPPPGAQIGANPYAAQVDRLQANPFAQQPERMGVMNYLSRLLK
jgi:hypothetical protein